MEKFYRKSGRPDGARLSYCIDCTLDWHSWHRVLKRYGVTKQDWKVMHARQGGACAICRTTLADIPDRTTHLDHDHASGEPRGLLCSGCNLGLGNFADDPGRLQAAIDYLARFTS